MGEGDFSSAKKGRGFFRGGRPHFLVQKTSDLSEIYGAFERTERGG